MAKGKAKLTKSASSTLKRFERSWDYAHQNHHSRWDRNWKLYNNERYYVGYKGISNTFVPMAFSTIETLTAALAAGRPSTDFLPQDMYKYVQTYYETGKKPDLATLNAQYDYFWDCDNWDLKSIKTIRSGFIVGTACEWLYWDDDKPRIINLHARDAIVDPTLSDPNLLVTDPGGHYGGRRYFTTLAALKEETVVDPETGEAKPRYKNLDRVVPGLSTGEEPSRDVKERSLGSVMPSEDSVEIIEIWDKDTIKSLANRTIEIESRPNDLGIVPLVVHRFIADEDIVYGKSIIDVIAYQQELLNDVTNQSVDAITDILSPQYELDPAYQDYIEKITNAPGVVYPFRPGSLQRVEKGVVPASAFNERMNMKNEIREATGADQLVKGISSDSNATATEVAAQLNQAGQRFELYVRMLEREGFYQRAKIVYRMMLHYQDEMQLVPTNTLAGPKFRAFDPTQYDESYEPKIQLEAHVRSARQKEQAKASESLQVMISDPTNDLWEIKKIMYPKLFDLTEEELDRIIGHEKPAPPAMGEAEGMLGAEGAEGGEMPPDLAQPGPPLELPAGEGLPI